LDNVFVERLWRSLKYEEVHLKAYANGLEARSGIGQWLRFYNERRPHQALDYKAPAAAWAAEVSPVDLPLSLDDAGASHTTPQGQQQQNVVHIQPFNQEEELSPYEPTPMVPRLGSTAPVALQRASGSLENAVESPIDQSHPFSSSWRSMCLWSHLTSAHAGDSTRRGYLWS
jgi:Integrase core domain